MFDAISYLKHRLELQTMEFCEKWDLVDTHGWLVPVDADVEAFMADRAREEEQEIAVVAILERLKDTIDTVPSPIIEKTAELYNLVGRKFGDKIAIKIIETLGYGFDPADATAFVQALNRALGLGAERDLAQQSGTAVIFE